VRVKVLEIELPTKPKPAAKDETGEERPDRDKRKKRRSSISLSIKALEQDPWMAQIGELRAGKAVRGTVVSTTEFGAFVEIAPNVQGLLHVSELERPDGREDPIAHANEILAVGDALVVVVERIERDRKRVALSLLDPSDLPAFEAGTLDDTGNADRVRPGGQVEVRVVGADRNGVRVRVAGVLGKRGRGFIRPGDTGTQRGTDLRKKFQVGTVLEVKVVGTDRDGSLRCSIKALAVDEERQAIKAYKQKAQKEGFGTLGDLLRSKLSER
jgi:small subunit ribosomal protein S1